jgi:hypothetical protein
MNVSMVRDLNIQQDVGRTTNSVVRKKGKSHCDSYPFFMCILSDKSLVANFSIREELLS